ncbi:MAG: AMP-binding protein [Chitinivibrionales bacterium]|nr:AMP-binding protein [Chitinivibrionales bacterium]MBD3395419.1 AMP-binding protein [Chitinivibrionales bacterium]
MSLGMLVERWARERPKDPALICEGRTISFGDLDKSINRVANGFQSLGIVRGDRVAIMLPNIPEFVYTFYACQKLGAVAVPFNTMYKGREISHILRDAGAKAIVCLTNSVQLINEVRSETPDLEHVITTGERTLTFADPESTVFVQAILGKSVFADLDDAYRTIGHAMLDAMVGLGVTNAWYRHRGSVRAEGHKLAGSLISEIEDVYIVNVLCFRGSIDPTDFLYALSVPPEVKDKAVEPLTSIEEQTGTKPSVEEVRDAVVAGLKKQLGVELNAGQLTREERFGYTKQRSLAHRRTKPPAAPREPLWPRIKRLFTGKK